LSPTNASPEKRALFHAGTLALGYGTLGFALRRIINKAEEEGRVEDASRLKAYVAARYPVVSPDPNLRDVKSEEKARALGVKPVEESPELAFVQKGAAYKGESPRHLALAAAATLAGGLGGWHLADFVSDTERREELDEAIAKKQNKIDKLVYKEYLRTRGLEDPMDKKAAEEMLEEFAMIEKEAEGIFADVRHDVKSWWLLYAAATAVLGYKGAKAYFDKMDPNRKRIKELQEIAREKAKVKDAPVLMDESAFPELEGAVKAKGGGRKLQSVGLPGKEQTKAPREALTDPKDPYANLLA
jgi:hypothetical protein